jgi:hypothetical protein
MIHQWRLALPRRLLILTFMRLQHDLGQSIALIDPVHDVTLWKYVYGRKPKPFFHPLSTPAGHCLSIFEPHDHPWHRGLWFTIKLINGENFWEENVEHGTQKTLAPPQIAHGQRERINIFSRQQWIRPREQGVAFSEQREISYQPLSADSYAIDFYTNLTAKSQLLLDRTPYTTWGGYGGLIFRGTRNWQKTRLLFSDGSSTDRPTGNRADWADLSGTLDGGIDQQGGIAIFDHPQNLRHPTPWYGGTEKYQNYLNAAFLFHEPLEVAEGQTLSFRYRVIVHDGTWDQNRLSAEYDKYTFVP